MKISVRQALEMLQAVGQLDSYNDGTLYKYDASTRLKLVIVRRKLRSIQDDYTEARNKLIEEISNGVGSIPPMNGSEESLRMHAAFAKGEINLSKTEIDLSVEPLDSSLLKLDENPIPAGVLDGLGPLLNLGG